MTQSQPKILIVEDNPLDAELTRWSLTEAGFSGTCWVVDDGMEAVALLGREGQFRDHQLPDLVILDLNLRLVDGPEVLDFIRQRPELSHIRVVILSSSPDFIMKSKASKADLHIAKSSSLGTTQ